MIKEKIIGLLVFAGIASTGIWYNYANNQVDFSVIKKLPKQDRMDLAAEQIFEMTKDPATNSIPTNRLLAANAYKQSLVANGRVNALTWAERGPVNMGGRTRAIIVDKRDATGNTLFAGGVGGGIWKTTNFKSSSCTWSKINDNLSNMAICSMVQDTLNPTVMYAGTGEGFFNADALTGAGVLKSTDGGNTWNVLSSTIGTTSFDYVQDLAVDRNGVVFACVRNVFSSTRGVQRSTDGGTTWTQVLGAPILGATGRAADIEIAKNGDIYICMGILASASAPGAIFKSSFAANGANTGAAGTWTDITPPTETSGAVNRWELAVSPVNSQKLLLLGNKPAGTDSVKIFISSNGGTTWTAKLSPQGGASASAPDFGAGQGWYNLIAQFHPSEENTVFIGALNCLRTTDFGDSWQQVSTWTGTSFPYVHADVHQYQFIKETNGWGLAIGCDGGLFYSPEVSSTTANPSFNEHTTNYSTVQYYGGDVHPTDINFFLGGAQDNGSHRFTTAGLNNITRVSGGDGAFCHIDQDDAQIQMTQYVYNQYYFSNNGGTSFSARFFSGTTGRFINPTDYDDAANVLYAAHNANTYAFISNVNLGAASTTFATKSVPLMGGRQVSAVKVDPNLPNVLYLGNSGGVPQILRIDDPSGTPVASDISIPGLPSGAYINSIEVKAGASSNMIVCVSNYGVNSVWETTNGGTTWTSIEGNLPDMPIYWAVYAPSNTTINGTTGGGVILGTENGAWTTATLNGASTVWTPDNSGFGNISTWMLKLNNNTRVLAAFTHGRGLFTTTLPLVPSSVNPTSQDKEFVNYISAMNNQLLIKTGTATNITKMQIEIVDMQGRVVLNQTNNYRTAQLPISQLPSGAYVVRVTSSRRKYVQQFVK
jgi:hypothetical protein